MNRHSARWLCALSGLVLGTSPLAAQTASAPPSSPELRKTVLAFVGHWTLTGTDYEPGTANPAPVQGTLDCKSAALGAAVTCLIVADVAKSRVEAAAVIGYSIDERVVHWMEISSTGEYHDHRGPWKDGQIVFEPLTYEAAGLQMTEYFSLSFPSAGKMTWTATTKASEGESRLELTASRVSTRAR